MNHGQLRSFHAVAQRGSFTAAARSLRVTQPAVTAQVKALESHYEVELFHRRGRGVALTATGEALFEVTRRMFSLEEEADNLLSAAGGLERGTLRVGADGPYHVMELLAAFSKRYPGIDVRVVIGNSEQTEAGLRDYRVDVALLATLGDDPDFRAVPYSNQPVVVFVAREHPWAGRRRIRLEELRDQPMIRREAGSITQRAFDEACARAGVQPTFVLEIETREAVREAVASGMGIGVVSRPEIGHDNRLHQLEIEDASISTREFMVCLASRRQARLVQAFFELAQEHPGYDEAIDQGD